MEIKVIKNQTYSEIVHMHQMVPVSLYVSLYPRSVFENIIN